MKDTILKLIVELEREEINPHVTEETKQLIDKWITDNGINREKETRWLIKSLPDLPLLDVKIIEQVYTEEGRLRSEQSRGIRRGIKCKKYKTSWGNLEIEEPCDPLLVETTPGPKIKKIRHIMRGPDGMTWEIDLFKDFIIAECEWRDKQPDVSWITGHDITGDQEWSNYNLALKNK